MIASDKAYFKSLFSSIPNEPPPASISQWIEGRRLVTAGPFKGYWRNDRAPYLVEIMDNFSPFSPIQRTVVMKGAQIGMTSAAENIIGFWLFAVPTDILYVSATQDLLEKWGTKRLEPLIDSLGMRGRMISPTEVTGSRRTGDKSFSKIVAGGSLSMASAQSAGSLRSETIRLLTRDEIDGAPKLLKTGEGNWMAVSDARIAVWKALGMSKTLDLSTPTTEETSNIFPAHEEGDKRKWFMPCPHCGKSQHLSLTMEEFPRRFIRDTEGLQKRPMTFCICEHCGKRMIETKSTDIILAGSWSPTRQYLPEETRDDSIRSYHIPTAISLMMGWSDLLADYNKKHKTPALQRGFVNLSLGWPFREAGRRPKIDNTATLRGAYQRRTVPQGVIYLTMGTDVQTGKDGRLECSIWGHGLGYRTWLIDHVIFLGDTTQPGTGAWASLNEHAAAGGLSFKRGDQIFQVQLIFIDSGDGNVTATVYQVAQSWRNTFPIKGENSLKTADKRLIEGDRGGHVSEIGYQRSQIGQSGNYFYRIGTNHYKKIIYRNLEIERVGAPMERLPQHPGFMDFPQDLEAQFLEQLLGEELREDGSYHPVKAGQRVEALDCTVYALAAGDVWLHEMTNRARERFKREHPEVSMQAVTENITPLVTLRNFAAQMGVALEE